MRKYIIILILSIGTSYLAIAQSDIIRGKVTSSFDGSGLPGVNIIIEGTNQGTTTDLEGNYSLDAESGDVLIFQMVGMQSIRMEVGSQTNIDVILEEERQLLEGVVVNGFREMDRNLFTGAAARIALEDIESPLTALSGFRWSILVRIL